MILMFKNRASGLAVFVGISSDGLVSLADKITNFIFVPLKDFNRFVKPEAFKVVQLMIDKFSVLQGEALRVAVIDEMSLQADFVREVSVLEYKKFVR